MQSYNATSRADHSRLSFFRLLVFVGAALALCAAPLAGETYPWQEQHATILPNGKLEWAPKPFVYEEGSTVYYIDYENGDDANSGTSTSAPWKHHPWDAEATGNADLAFGPATYVFKRGVIYRGNLYNGNDDIGSMYADSGTAAEPIRLTSDPNWGTGAAKFYGSVKLEGWVRADDPSIPTPARIPNPEKVWAVNLVDLGIMDADGKYIQDYRMPDQSPYPTNSYWPGYAEPWQYSLFRVNSPDDIERVWLSTNPNWEEGNPAYAMSYWPRMTGQSQLVLEEGTENETTIRGSILNTEAVGHPADYYAGGYAWMPWDSLMGTPQIREIPLEKTVTLPDEETEATYTVYDPATGTLNGVFPAAGAAPNLPYMIFNLPQFLDSAGEFYVDKTTGYLFYRPADGEDANDIHLEFSTCLGAIALESVSHIEITGLEFAFHLKDTIYVKPEDVTKTVTDIRIANCEFYHQLGTVLLFRSQASHDNYLPIDNIYITDNKFFDLANTAIHLEGYGGYAEVLRNKITNTGFWNIASQWSPLTALGVSHYDTMTVAGNIVESTWGSGIRANGGIKNYSGLDRGGIDYDRPLSRNYVYQNQTNDNARGVNDYGGLALWQGGPTYAWSNNIGSSVGHLPAGWRGTDPTNLSYPLYLDGAYKHYCFNNIVWGASDDPEDTYRNSTPGYFMVFGFLNQFANNTIYRQSRAVGGSSGARNEFVSNLGAEINDGGFFGTDGHVLNPSLEGGGDDGSLGVRGLPTLAYARNVAHTPTVNGMGTVKLADDENNLVTDIKAVDIETMISQMEANGIRYPYIGIQTDDPALPNFDGRLQSSADLEPRIAADSAAIDAGATYFVPFALSANVGEWHFIENHNDAAYITDYHFYMTKAMFNRKMYDKVPSHPLVVNSATLDDYVDVPREDWAKGGLYFDGTMYASLSDTVMREDIVLDYNENMNHKDDVGGDPWVIEITEYINDDEGNPVGYGTQTYPGDLRKTLCIKTSNILVEADIKVDAGTTGEILGKHDGSTGYRLFVNSANQFEFMVSAAGTDYSIATNAATAVNDGNWHHVIAEIDRATGVMSIYLNGNAVGTGGSNSTTVSLASDVSIDNSADYVVGANSSLSNNLSGVLDFMRVSQGTLADAQTTIDEVYAWQTDGPWTKDYFGNDPVGRRDAGAIEYTGYLNPPSNMVIAYNQPGQYVTVSWDDNSTSETGFRLERSTSPRFDENLMVANLDPDTTSYIDTTAVTGTTYYYRIYAVENGTDSPRSSVIKSAMSTATPAVPANVVFAIDETASTVAVDWDILDLSNTTNQPEKWKVKWSTTMGGPYTESSDLVYSDYTITGVDTSAPLYVVVDAINASDTTSTVEFIVFNDAMDFTGLADGALPSGWTASLDSTGEISTVSVATPTELVSPTGTPMIRYVDWSKDMFVTNDSSSDYSYYKVQATFANGGTNGYDSKGLTFAFLDTTNNAKLVINSSDDLKFSWDDISESITIIADDGEAAGDRVMDIGEFWTLSVSILPAEIVGLVDLHITLIDETGANRLPTSENAVNDDGVWILRNVTIPASGIAGKYGSYATVANGGTSVDKGIWFDSITVTPIGGTISEDVTASPLVHYDFDDNGGSTATDASGNGRDGSITGATWSGDTPDGSTSSLSFDGSGDLVEDADAADYLDGLDAYTVTVWVKSNSDTNNAGIYRLTTGSGDSKNHLRYDVAGWGGGGTKVLKAGFETTTTSVQGESADNAMSTDWQHIALSWSSGGEPKLYLDGQPFDWDTDANPFAPGTVDGVLSGVQTLLIGAGGQSETWDGWIDDFRIYDRALSASEVQAVFDAAGSGGGATV
ncbi:MAG: LamG-like jellyroll fold domain-containing protein, partial [Candidatus Sumerlaeia bacterium]